MKQTLTRFSRTALFLTLSLPFLALSCERDPEIQPVKGTPPPKVYPDSLAGVMKVEFLHNVDGQPLIFDSQQYVNKAGNTYRIASLRYYISNLKLKNGRTGQTFALEDSYYLVRPKENKTILTLRGIPVKEYDQVEFSIGVAPKPNGTLMNSGDLDPGVAEGMAWGWKTGYKFMEFEGWWDTNNQSTGRTFHIGGNSQYRTVNFPMPEVLRFRKDSSFTVEFDVDVNSLFRFPNLIDFNVVNSFDQITDPDAGKMADNYGTGMFSFKEIKK